MAESAASFSSLFVCLLRLGVGMSDQGAGIAQTETTLPEQTLALTHSQTDVESSRDPCPQRLAIPQRAVQSAVARRLGKRPEFLSITHKLHSDHDAQFYVGES